MSDVLARCRRMREEVHAGVPIPAAQGPGRVQYVYFIQRGAAGPIKIGQTRDVERRRTELQQACAERLTILAKSQSYNEAQLHEFYDDEWIRGEWFRPSPRLLAFIEQLDSR